MTWFRSRRSALTARRGIVATSHPIAVQAGLQVLMQGGHAVDAAVATSAALGVVELHNTGSGATCSPWRGTRAGTRSRP